MTMKRTNICMWRKKKREKKEVSQVRHKYSYNWKSLQQNDCNKPLYGSLLMKPSEKFDQKSKWEFWKNTWQWTSLAQVKTKQEKQKSTLHTSGREAATNKK